MKEIELNINNYSKCICPVCQVQSSSQCIVAKRDGWTRMRRSVGEVLRQYPDHPEAYDQDFSELEQSETGKNAGFSKPQPAEMLDLYCNKFVNKSDCDDLDDEQQCQCPSCAVQESHGLDGYKYCLWGSLE